MDFRKNVGEKDSLVRLSGGIILGVLSINALIDKCIENLYSPVFGVLAIILIVTAVTRKCPCNMLVGLDTTKFDEDESEAPDSEEGD